MFPELDPAMRARVHIMEEREQEISAVALDLDNRTTMSEKVFNKFSLWIYNLIFVLI